MNAIISYFKDVAEDYLQDITLADISLMKVCLLALGMLFGLAVPIKHKTGWAFALVVVFAITYTPLMYKLLPYLVEER